MMNWIGSSQSGHVSCFQHSKAKVAFFPHVEEVFTKTSKRHKYVPPHGMRGADKRVSHIHPLRLWNALPNDIILAHVNVWDSNSAYPLAVEVRKRLFHRPRRSKHCIIIQRKNEIRRSELDTSIALERWPARRFELVVLCLGKLAPNHVAVRFIVPIIHH